MMSEPSPAIRDFISTAALEPSQLALILGPFYARLDVGLIDDVQDIVEKALAHGYKKGCEETTAKAENTIGELVKVTYQALQFVDKYTEDNHSEIGERLCKRMRALVTNNQER